MERELIKRIEGMKKIFMTENHTVQRHFPMTHGPYEVTNPHDPWAKQSRTELCTAHGPWDWGCCTVHGAREMNCPWVMDGTGPGSIIFPWAMDCTGWLGLQNSHGPWTVQEGWEYRTPGEYRIPMDHGPYRMLRGTGFPWTMDRTGCLGVQNSHEPWTVQDAEGYRIPMGHGPYRAPGSTEFPWATDCTGHLRVQTSSGLWTG